MWHNPEMNEWQFAEANGLVFGLSAAVCGFNRWPIVMTSLARRVAAVPNTNYFDDVFGVDTVINSRSGKKAVTSIVSFCGGTFGAGKAVPPGTHRAFIGIYSRLDSTAEDGTVTLEPRELCRLDIQNMRGRGSKSKEINQESWQLGTYTCT